jgi:glycogen operon protein
MICAGDEIARTQGGNNNGYCQDTEISWHDWNLDESRKALLDYTSRLINYRRKHPNFHRRSFYEKDPSVSSPSENVRWFRTDGQPMGDQDWAEGGWMRTLGMYLPGDAAEIRDAEGTPVEDHDFLLVLNAHHEPVDFKLAEEVAEDDGWAIVFDTNRPDLKEDTIALENPSVTMEGRSLVVLRRPRHQRRQKPADQSEK